MIDLNEFFSMKMPCQVHREWFGFIQFCQAYFITHRVTNPLVVEIGTHANDQRPFYKKYLNATHVGIEIDNKYSEPDILGDSRSPETVIRLTQLLRGRDIDLLFIDALHDYESVKRDYENYGHMTKHIVAFHDIRSWPGVAKYWAELQADLEQHTNYRFMDIGVIGVGEYTDGIGLIVKGEIDVLF
jgi:hypothetical protein